MQQDNPTVYAVPVANWRSRWWLWTLIAIAGIWTVVSLPFGVHWALVNLGLLKPEHHVVILVSSDDENEFGHAIAYPVNIARAYALKNESVKIEIVANSSGIKLFRADTSPLQPQLAQLRQAVPGLVFSMCNNSKQIAERKEGHPIDLIPGATLVPFGIGRVLELQDAGWTYIGA
jgi:intracellular sulfur oxidation DsrE/DsrF family protein